MIERLLRARVRQEPFGKTVWLERPGLLVMLGPNGGEQVAPSAPFEAHLTIDGRCRRGCSGCYIGANPAGRKGLPDEYWRNLMERLARAGVLHLALGAGEDTSLERLVGLGREARKLGMVPSLSTSGSSLTPKIAMKLGVFEQVHLNLDGTAKGWPGNGLPPWPAEKLLALRILRAYHGHPGVNLVVTRSNIDGLGKVFQALSNEGVRSIELLRIKPAGRALASYRELAPEPRQWKGFTKRILRLAARWLVRVRLDCSFAPFVCSDGFDPELLRRVGLAGCVAGSWIVAAGPNGKLTGCSFMTQPVVDPLRQGPLDELRKLWNWTDRAPEPCRSCRYLEICRGGCRVVSCAVRGDSDAPDPECPMVRAFRAQAGGSSSMAHVAYAQEFPC